MLFRLYVVVFVVIREDYGCVVDVLNGLWWLVSVVDFVLILIKCFKKFWDFK